MVQSTMEKYYRRADGAVKQKNLTRAIFPFSPVFYSGRRNLHGRGLE